jgi:hypothetical protein
MDRTFTESKKTKATGVSAPAALLNNKLDYAPLGDLVQANIDGFRLAADAIEDLNTHFADPDALYLALKTIAPDTRDTLALTRMRGFMRALQKALSRSAV